MKELAGHAVAGQLLQVLERGQGPFAAEAVEAPEHHQVELLLVSLEQQGLEFSAVGLAPGLLVGEHLIEGAVLLGEGAQLVQLVLGILALGFCGYAGVNGYSHN